MATKRKRRKTPVPDAEKRLRLLTRHQAIRDGLLALEQRLTDELEDIADGTIGPDNVPAIVKQLMAARDERKAAELNVARYTEETTDTQES